MNPPESIVVVTRKTALEELVERFNTKSQTKFYLEQTAAQNPGARGPDFAEYQAAHDRYHAALDELRAALPHQVKCQWIERGFLPTYSFAEGDLIVVIGPDGLVINTAKYLTHQPILAINPDSTRIDGVLSRFSVTEAEFWLQQALSGTAPLKPLTMAKATLNDGQTLYAVNDLFIGARTHVSARYRLEFEGKAETQSSSGLIVSTGAGSTGWLTSVLVGACRLSGIVIGKPVPWLGIARFQRDWSIEELYFAVREPFPSRVTQVDLTWGTITTGSPLTITSQMPENGVIFSDGIESDYVAFNSGAIATISIAERKALMISRTA
jgi:NAD kinase